MVGMMEIGIQPASMSSSIALVQLSRVSFERLVAGDLLRETARSPSPRANTLLSMSTACRPRSSKRGAAGTSSRPLRPFTTLMLQCRPFTASGDGVDRPDRGSVVDDAFDLREPGRPIICWSQSSTTSLSSLDAGDVRQSIASTSNAAASSRRKCSTLLSRVLKKGRRRSAGSSA